MDIVELLKTYTFCVYLFFTVCFWFLLFIFIINKYKKGDKIIYCFLFFLITFLFTPFLWPLLGANFMIKNMTKTKG